MAQQLVFKFSWKKFSQKPLPISHLLTDVILIFIAWYSASLLRLGFNEIPDHIQVLNRFFPWFLLLRVLCFYFLGVYQTIWRYTSTHDAKALFRAVAISSAFLITLSYFLPDWGRVPRSIFLIDFLMLGLLMAGIRLGRRLHWEAKQSQIQNKPPSNRVLIFGAGFNGKALAQRIQTDHQLQLDMIGFIDDDPKKLNRSIFGFKVLGDHSDLENLLESTQANQLILAIPNPDAELIRSVVATCRKFNIQPQLITEFAHGGPKAKNLKLYRDLKLSDLLPRNSKEIDFSSVEEIIRGKRVLITGAGGSIGSELCRQILRFEASQVLLLDHSEFHLYQIEKELRPAQSETRKVIPLLIDIKDDSALQRVFVEYSPDVVFHAAAYKHVHLVEANPYVAIRNNVEGTQNLLECCLKHKVQNFVMISSDKAVNPVGVMGSTKRICEYLVTAAGLSSNYNYCSVRFGNVLGSSGSLIPLLRTQIQEGGPVTITHQDMTRYFMLIPEAVSLVLMAGAISKPGDINVLKMGEPIKIVDIARSLIALMGRTKDEIPILFTGLRPGEKMFEELYLSGNELETKHPDILTLPSGDSGIDEIDSDWNLLKSKISYLSHLANKGEKEALILLNQFVKDPKSMSRAHGIKAEDTKTGPRWDH